MVLAGLKKADAISTEIRVGLIEWPLPLYK